MFYFIMSFIFFVFFFFFFFFFNDTATTEIYTLSLHDALPISNSPATSRLSIALCWCSIRPRTTRARSRSEEHTSELQSLAYLVCRLLLEKKKKITIRRSTQTKKQQTKKK